MYYSDNLTLWNSSSAKFLRFDVFRLNEVRLALLSGVIWRTHASCGGADHPGGPVCVLDRSVCKHVITTSSFKSRGGWSLFSFPLISLCCFEHFHEAKRQRCPLGRSAGQKHGMRLWIIANVPESREEFSSWSQYLAKVFKLFENVPKFSH